MSAVMKLSGIILTILGIGLGGVSIWAPGRMDIYGIKPDTAAILLVGGLLCLGLAGVIDAVRLAGSRRRNADQGATETQPAESNMVSASPVAFGRRNEVAAVATTAAVGAGIAAAAQSAAVSAKSADPVADTISALEQAKADVIKSMGGMDNTTGHHVPEPAHAEPLAEASADEQDAPDTDEEALYVLDEKVIRGRPARILSDDTVEAETEEGWMRFENLEHLNEYLDSVEEQAVK